MKKKVFACLLAVVMLLGMIVVPAAAKAEGEEAKEIVILYTNDVHAGVEKNIGYAGIARIKAALEAAGKEVLLVDCGDSVQGELIGTLSRGETNIELMNTVGYDVATIGNHEFDYGMEQFNKNVSLAKFQYVCCNFLDKDGKQVLAPYTILEVAGKKIAFVGIDTPQTFTSSTPVYFQDADGNWIFSFCGGNNGQDLYDKVQETVDAARAEGVDYVIALAHLGIDFDSSPWMSTDVLKNTSGIDVLLDGHSHSVLENATMKNKNGETVIYTSTGTKLENLGMLTIGADGSFSTTLINDGVMPMLNAAGLMQEDKGVGEAVQAALAANDELKNKVVAHTDVDLIVNDPVSGERLIRRQETNLGDLVSDAYRAIGDADIGVINGGGVRAIIKAGDITFGNMLEVHPFNNGFCVIETTGQQILDALELSVHSLPGDFGGFLHVSGLKYTIDMNVDSTVVLEGEDEMFKEITGERRIKNVQVLQADGTYAPLDPEKTYKVAGIDYILKNKGNGYSMFAGSKVLQEGSMLDHEVVINYIVDVLGGNVGSQYLDPYGEGRVTFIQKGE